MSLRGGCSARRSNLLIMVRLLRSLVSIRQANTAYSTSGAHFDINSLPSLSTFVPVFPLRVPSFVSPPPSRLPTAGLWSDAHNHREPHTQDTLCSCAYARR